jgi:hypothetical protein
VRPGRGRLAAQGPRCGHDLRQPGPVSEQDRLRKHRQPPRDPGPAHKGDRGTGHGPGRGAAHRPYPQAPARDHERRRTAAHRPWAGAHPQPELSFGRAASCLDARLRIELRAELRRLQSRHGYSLFMASPDFNEALAIADSVSCTAGRLVRSPAPNAYDEPVDRRRTRPWARRWWKSSRPPGGRESWPHGAAFRAAASGRRPGHGLAPFELGIRPKPSPVRPDGAIFTGCWPIGTAGLKSC